MGLQEAAKALGIAVIILDLLNSLIYISGKICFRKSSDVIDHFQLHKQSTHYIVEALLRVAT